MQALHHHETPSLLTAIETCRQAGHETAKVERGAGASPVVICVTGTELWERAFWPVKLGLVLFAFKAGQQLREHRTSSQIFVQALRGRITFTAAGNSIRLQAGMVLQVEAQVPHQVVALTNAVLLVTMVPSPAYHSLEHEVFHHLTPLVTRTVGASKQGGERAIEKEQ